VEAASAAASIKNGGLKAAVFITSWISSTPLSARPWPSISSASH
jgi:hypothetical protein